METPVVGTPGKTPGGTFAALDLGWPRGAVCLTTTIAGRDAGVRDAGGREEAGQPTGWTGWGVLQEKIAETRIAELTEAVAARDAFIMVAAHELRNPMTPIVGQIEFLLEAVRRGRCDPEQVRQRLEKLQGTVYRYMKRAGVLLDVSRITSGNLKLKPEPFDLAVLIGDVVQAFADVLRLRRVALTVVVPDSLWVVWDRLAAEQIVDNLLSNAIKHGGGTPVVLTVDCAKNGMVVLTVRDHGLGVLPEDQVRVFQRFEQVVCGDKFSRGGGFGVGLWVVQQLVRAMGGTVTVQAPEDGLGGALFQVVLPQK